MFHSSLSLTKLSSLYILKIVLCLSMSMCGALCPLEHNTDICTGIGALILFNFTIHQDNYEESDILRKCEKGSSSRSQIKLVRCILTKTSGWL